MAFWPFLCGVGFYYRKINQRHIFLAIRAKERFTKYKGQIPPTHFCFLFCFCVCFSDCISIVVCFADGGGLLTFPSDCQLSRWGQARVQRAWDKNLVRRDLDSNLLSATLCPSPSVLSFLFSKPPSLCSWCVCKHACACIHTHSSCTPVPFPGGDTPMPGKGL